MIVFENPPVQGIDPDRPVRVVPLGARAEQRIARIGLANPVSTAVERNLGAALAVEPILKR
jgi:hypothetical protein